MTEPLFELAPVPDPADLEPEPILELAEVPCLACVLDDGP